MNKVEFEEVQNIISQQMKYGIFLNTEVDGKPNMMTIAWGVGGRMWDRNCFTVAVRHSRYTFELMEESEYFTVSIPEKGTLKKELAVCGTVSGREKDKFAETGLTPLYVNESPVPVIKEAMLHVVCKIAYKQSMDPSLINSDYVKNKYRSANQYSHNHHTMYYGEVVAVYMNE
jgi:flavin reductase (DIM6/NTAB) family NADH-FMN oxidoreductase RutF